MRILVCVAQVADPAAARFDLETASFGEPEWTPNPLDLVALEAAVRLGEERGAEVVAVSAGPERVERVLRDALVQGAGRAARLEVEPVDAFTAAAALAAAARRIEADLVLCGGRTADEASGSVPAYLAAALDAALLTGVVAVEAEERAVVAVAADTGGRRASYRLPFPAVVSVEEALAEPRYVPVLSGGYRRGLLAGIETWDAEGLGLATSEPLLAVAGLGAARPRTKAGAKVTGLSMREKLSMMRGQSSPAEKKEREILTGPADAAARAIVARLEEWL